LISEETISPDKALSVLSISSEDATNPDKLKTAYRQASKKNHPDMGGSEEAMKDVNAAYDFLSKHGSEGGSLGTTVSKRDVWDEISKEHKQWASFVKEDFEKKFKPENYIKYFSEITGEEIGIDFAIFYPKKEERSPSLAGLKVKFKNKDGSVYFFIDVYVWISELRKEPTLGAEHIEYPIVASCDVYFNRRKQTITKGNYTSTHDHDLLTNPEKLFPKSKIEKLFKRGKVTKFTRKDMSRAITSELNGKVYGDDSWIIPIGTLGLFIYRMVILRTGIYTAMGIYKDRKRINTGASATFKEEEETIDFLKKLQNDLKNETDESKIINIVNEELKKVKKLS